LTLAPRVGALDPWIDALRRAGIRGGVERRRTQLERAIAAMRALPADGVTLAAFANDVLGDSHALDFGRALPKMIADGVAIALGRPISGSAEDTRQLWEDVGVAPDVLSSTVLCLGLRAQSGHPLAGFLATSADVSEPVVLTLAQLRRWPLDLLPATRTAYVVENPSVIAEAAGRDWPGPVLVCSSGRPTVAVVTLIRQLLALGASVRQHADFDASGLAITAWLAERAGTSPWRMSAEDYVRALRTDRRRVPLVGTVAPATWDPALTPAMLEAGVAIFEEEVRSELLDSIADPSAPLDGQEIR
jgi:uncharacterized protein (TIGR02679 family)